ncbi:hypothetical protein [Devosia beringensis]|uniref:hypothetical protein n=1 Tax=Devosia beringensis TaxID=2657486 RepID=UPI00186B5F21|nr:hypothetical protein [Devosia beringensis]
MRDVTHFVVVFPTRLMAASYDEKKVLMDALQRQYPHYEFDALEAFEGSMADDDDFAVIPVTGVAGQCADADEVRLCRPLDPLVIPELLRSLGIIEGSEPLRFVN